MAEGEGLGDVTSMVRGGERKKRLALMLDELASERHLDALMHMHNGGKTLMARISHVCSG